MPNLFSVDETSPRLPEEERKFHSEVATLLFLCFRIRCDIMAVVVFLDKSQVCYSARLSEGLQSERICHA